MNYSKIYYNLLEKRRNFPVKKDVYQERHHIIPRCLGGNDNSDNIIALTAREHYVAHLLLVKIYKNDSDKTKYYKMLYALECMTLLKDPSRYNLGYDRRFKMNSRLFEFIKIEISKAKSYICSNAYAKLSDSEKELRRKQTSEAIKKYYQTHSSKWIGRKHKSESIQKMKEYSSTKPIYGLDNPIFGKIWICNDSTKECILWDKETDIPQGWRKGRLFKNKDSYEKLSHPGHTYILGKICIHDNFNHDKYIDPSDPIPEGWFRGRTPSKTGNHRKPTKSEIRKMLQTRYQNSKISDDQVKEWYQEYLKNGYWGVVEKFHYDKSCPNLVGIFKSRIPDFIPQQGKRRKSNLNE